jgi:hypothetical protein
MKETTYTLLCFALIAALIGCDDLNQRGDVDLSQVGGDTPLGEMGGSTGSTTGIEGASNTTEGEAMEDDLAGDDVERPLSPDGGSTGAGETPYEGGEEMMIEGGAISAGEGGEVTEAGTEMMTEAGEMMTEAGAEVMTEAGAEVMTEAGAEVMAGSEGGAHTQLCVSNDDCGDAERCTVDSTCETITAIAVDFCRLQFPLEISTAEPGGLTTIYGRLYHEGITDLSSDTDPNPLVLAEVGYGADGVIPDDTWRWREAIPNAYYDGATLGGYEANNDEYMGEMITPEVGQYDFAFRFSVDRGTSWTICDFGLFGAGSSDGYVPEDAGQLNVF